MRRRVAVAMVVMVVLALVLAGMGTLVLSRSAARRSAEAELRDQAVAVAELVGSLGTPRDGAATGSVGRPDGAAEPRVPAVLLRRLGAALTRQGEGDRDLGVVIVGPGGRSVGELPPGVELTAAQELEVRSGGVASGASPGGDLYAAAGRQVGRSVVVVGITGTTRSLFAGAARWFLLSAALVVALAVAVAVWLGNRFSRPVQEATAVTERIAAGDLTARLPEPDPTDRDEAAVLARSVNSMADAVERSRALEQQFLMSVSHDLRTPLTNIRGYAEAITDGATPAPDGAGVILRESARLERLVQDLLDLARLEAHQFTLHPAPADLAAVVAETAEAHHAEAAASSLDLAVRTNGPLHADLDVDRTAQVVGNLIANAIRFAATTIVVSTSAETDPDGTRWARIEVRDDGRGIDPADVRNVFDRLYQGRDRPRRSESGGGLGLAIVKELVAAMGGTVGVSTPPGQGTTFWFRVPLGPVS